MKDMLLFKVDNRRVKIFIYGKELRGIKKFRAISSTGKTRLYNICVNYSIDKLPVAGYSYIDYQRGIKLSDYLNKGIKLLIIDRYDMFNGMFAKEIVELSKNCMVILDCKEMPNIGVVTRLVDIDMNPTSITIR